MSGVFLNTWLRWKVGRATLSCWSISTTPRGCSHLPHQQLLKSIFAQARRPRGCSVRPLLARGGLQQWPPLRPGLRLLHGAAFVNAFSAHHRLNNHLQEHPTAVREEVPVEGHSPDAEPRPSPRCWWTRLCWSLSWRPQHSTGMGLGVQSDGRVGGSQRHSLNRPQSPRPVYYRTILSVL